MEEPMTYEQRKKLNAMCGDVSNQVPWMVNGIIRKMHKDQWRHFFCAHVIGCDKASSIEGDQIVIFSRSSNELNLHTAQSAIDLIQHFGDSKQVVWSDPTLASQIKQAKSADDAAKSQEPAQEAAVVSAPVVSAPVVEDEWTKQYDSTEGQP
jgi:hypothetical protein